MIPITEERRIAVLTQRLAEAEATIEALLSGQIDAVVDAKSHTPVLLAKAQEALRQERDRAQRYLDTPDVILLVVDLDGRITLVNRYACSILGWTADELIGRKWIDTCLPHRMRVTLTEKLHEMIAGRLTVLENPILTKSGEERLIEWRNTVLRDDAGDVCGVLSSGSDITERRLVETALQKSTADLLDRTTMLEEHGAALRKNEERTTYALGAIRMGIWELDIATRQITWSPTMAEVFGLRPEQAPGDVQGFFQLIHPDDRQMVEASFSQAEQAGTDFKEEFRVLWPDSSSHWIAGRARLSRAREDESPHWLGVIMDIGERKTLEAQFRQAQKMEAVGQLAGGVAHDFNNLLTSILGYSGFVIDSFSPQDERRADMDEVIKAGERAAGLTRQLLAFSRKQVLQPTRLDLNALVTGMYPMLSRLIGEQVELVPSLAPELSNVRADPGQLEQVLMNLVVNARDAMPSGGRLMIQTANVELDGSFMQDVKIHPGPYVMLAVSDTGDGMTEATKSRLFEPFFTTKGPGKGTGLGLATVYGIVKQSGGYVWVFSDLGKGTSFKVYLPRSEEDAKVVHPPSPDDTPCVGTETILVVEDEDAVRLLTRRILEDARYRVFDAPNPQQAEELFGRHPNTFSLLLSDVVMPGSSGPKLFERLVRRQPNLRVLYLSGYTDSTMVDGAELDPGAQLLQKPFAANALKRKVREVLDGH
jgi:two-component system, cell cycle sensor histidine kinase and response regulator CckA